MSTIGGAEHKQLNTNTVSLVGSEKKHAHPMTKSSFDDAPLTEEVTDCVPTARPLKDPAVSRKKSGNKNQTVVGCYASMLHLSFRYAFSYNGRFGISKT